ncbi:MFS transporter [Streptomyces eurythermus]
MSNASPTIKAAPGARPGPEGAVPWLTLSTVMIGMFMAILDSFIVVVAGPAIQDELKATASELQWVLAGYQLGYAVVLITGGRLADLYGRKRVFVIGTAIFTLRPSPVPWPAVRACLSVPASSRVSARP